MRFFRLLGLALAYLGACSAYAAYDPLGPGVGTALQLPAAGSGAIALVISPTNYGAKCDGSTDDSTALTSWAAAITAGVAGYIPGNCIYKTPLVFANANNTALYGNGTSSRLTYAGASTTGNLITIYSAVANACSGVGMSISNLQLRSTTVMTGGEALRINGACQMSIFNLDVGGGSQGDGNFYDGLHFNGGNTVDMVNYQLRSSHTAEIVNGWASTQFTDLFQTHGTVVAALVGIDMAGNVGGLNIVQADILLSGTNIKIDQSQVAVPNLQLFLGSNVFLDTPVTSGGGAGIDMDIADAGAAGSSILTEGAWFASAPTACIKTETNVNWRINITGGVVFSCPGDGIQNNSIYGSWNITGTTISANTGWGINNTVVNANIAVNGVLFRANTAGNFTGIQPNSYSVDGTGPTNGPTTITDTSTNSTTSLVVGATSSTSGVNIKMIGNGGSTPKKYIRTYGGVLQFLSDAYALIFAISDSGGVTAPGLPTSAGGGGLYVCVDSTGVLYKKASCP